MKKTLLSLLFLSATFFFSSCNKDDDPVVKTKTELLTSANWKFAAATVGGTDVSALLQACQKDNILTFVSNGSGTADEGPTKCNAANPQTSPFTWNFTSNETVLNISATLFTGGSGVFNIITINETQLVLSQNITVSGTTQNAIITFLH